MTKRAKRAKAVEVIIGFRVSEALCERIEREAERDGRTVSDVVRRAIEAYLSRRAS